MINLSKLHIPLLNTVRQLAWVTMVAVYLCLFLPQTVSSQQEESAPSEVIQTPFYARIGVILPLSGKYSQFGEQALKGILLAAAIFEAGEGEPGIEIVVRDTKDDPAASERAVEELANNEEVFAIIGPLLSATAMESARKAQELKIPMVALSQKSGLTNAGDYIFRNSLLSNEQAKTIADYTLNKLRSKKIAILYPNSAYGTELANLFREEVKRGQGEVVAEEQYREGQTNFGNEVVRLFKIKETEKRDGRRKVKTFEKTVTADALYIPDYFDTVGLIAPHLAYYGIKNIKLLGSNGWNSPRLIELAGKYVEGAVFADSFFIDSKKESTEEFVYNFRSTYGMEPDILSAQAYDAVMMVVEAIEAAGEKREKIRDRLANLKDFRGVTGIITFNKDREAIKELFILTVKNGRIVELN